MCDLVRNRSWYCKRSGSASPMHSYAFKSSQNASLDMLVAWSKNLRGPLAW